MTPGVIHEHAPHHVRGDGEELHPVNPLGARLVHEPEVCLVDDGGRGERVAYGLESQLPVGNPRQVSVDERDEAVQRARNSVAHVAEHLGDRVLLRRACHAPSAVSRPVGHTLSDGWAG
jgi:hypothetical protein